MESYDLLLIVAGIAVLGTAVLPRVLHDKPFTLPMTLVGIGLVAFWLPLGLDSPDPIGAGNVTERLTELGVIVSLMTAGLTIDRAPGLRAWSPTWRLLGVTMPLTIVAAALLGWSVAGLVPATAALFGAAISPTDPVMGKDVEVGAPGEGAEDEETEEYDLTGPGEEDEVRFALTSEAGLNDGLAFPYTNLAIAMAIAGAAPGNWIGAWLVVDVVFKLTVSVLLGIGLGRILAHTLLSLPARTDPAKTVTGLGALAATLVVYGLTEYVGGYGFIATFIAAVTIRASDRWHELHAYLQTFSEQAERLLMSAILVLFGGAIARGLFAPLDGELVVVAVLIVLVVRPAAGAVGLIGFDRAPWRERAAISFFGMRGIATFYYLSHGLEEAEFAQKEEIWAVAGLVVLLSIVINGVSAAPTLEALDRRREAT
ncbi:MAG: cation:proton antiporter [Actinobacteria bacterium]|nr:cation:proton antiporter [Actinomycetota bacterium]